MERIRRTRRNEKRNKYMYLEKDEHRSIDDHDDGRDRLDVEEKIFFKDGHWGGW